MRKTGSQTESDWLGFLNGSPLKSAISGGIYKDGTRPAKSDKEDAVISFLTGLGGQVQTGVLNLNIYVPDIDNGSEMPVRDITRCEELEALIETVIHGIVTDDYDFFLDNMIQTFPAEEVHWHFVNARIKFRIITD